MACQFTIVVCVINFTCNALERLYSPVLYVYPQKQKDVLETVCRIPMITSAKEEQRMIATCRKVAYKLHYIQPVLADVYMVYVFPISEIYIWLFLKAVLVSTQGLISVSTWT